MALSFATYFDKNYLLRVLALYYSLARHCADFHLFVLCMDAESRQSLTSLELPGITSIALEELEQEHPSLLQVKQERSKLEYYYTCGPAFLLYLTKHHPAMDLLTYLDADLFFFSDPKPLFDELAGYSVAITEHRFAVRQEKLKRFGIYNVGWVSFRVDVSGLECLRWWSQRCIEWCHDRVEGNRYADQKYLEEFPVRFRGVRVIQHKGANVGPWNVSNHQVTEREDQVWIDDEPLIFFHFHGFKVLSPWLFDTNLGWYQASPSAVVKRKIFGPYIHELKRLNPSAESTRNIREKTRGFGILVRSARVAARVSFGIFRRAYIVAFRETIL